MTRQRDWASAFSALARAGVAVRTYAYSAPLYIHAKAIVVDPGTRRARAFVGSQNFSVASLLYDRELGTDHLAGSARRSRRRGHSPRRRRRRGLAAVKGSRTAPLRTAPLRAAPLRTPHAGSQPQARRRATRGTRSPNGCWCRNRPTRASSAP